MAIDAIAAPTRIRRIHCSATLVFAAWLASTSIPSASDDTLDQAKALYASAAYDEALAILDRAAPTDDVTSFLEYRVLCLLALDRSDEARRTIETLLRQNPQYLPPADQMSPRIQKVFLDVRRDALPRIVLDRYGTAKAAFERKDPQAVQQFDALLALLDDPDARHTPVANDLRTVVSAYRDLTLALAATAAAPPAPPIATPPVAAGNAAKVALDDQIFRAGDVDVLPPVVRSQPMPPWTRRTLDPIGPFAGILEILVDADGRVAEAAIRRSVHPAYDKGLLTAARTWTFTPATRRGAPVRYLKVIEVQLLGNSSSSN